MRMRTLVICLLSVLLIASLGLAQYSARESFEYPKGDTISAVTGLAINGWSDSWTYNNDTPGLQVIGDTDLVYADMTFPVTNVGNHVTVTAPGSWTASRYRRTLDKTWPDEAGKVYWTSFIFDSKLVPTGNTYYIVKFFENNNERFAVGKAGGGTNYTCGSGWPGSSGDDVSAVACEGGPVWLVTATYMTGDANDERTFMWVNPDPAGAAPDTNLADVKRFTTMNAGFNNVRIECGGELTNKINFDEIRIGTDWISVSSQLVKVGVDEQGRDNMPTDFALSQNYPNPFNPTTQLSYSVLKSGFVSLKVYNLLGQHVATLFEGVRQTGQYQATFNANNLPSGVYFARLQNGMNSLTKKMMLLK